MKPIASIGITLLTLTTLAGCGSEQAKDRDFHTSGSKDADMRADQRISKDQQLKGGDPGAVGAKEEKKTLYDRLGGEQGLIAIVDDFTTRVMADPTVNWERKGITQGGVSIHRNRSIQWDASPDNVAQLKKHLVQFFALKTGGPTTGPMAYDGKDMKSAHEGMQITKAEFDASIGDLKATLDAKNIPTQEQKELLAIAESTLTQVAEER